jgi:hypothetical protein
MKLCVIHDSEGIIQAGALVSDEPSKEGNTIECRPLPGEKQTAAEIELPDQYSQLDLETLCTRFRVDGGGDRPRLAERRPAR